MHPPPPPPLARHLHPTAPHPPAAARCLYMCVRVQLYRARTRGCMQYTHLPQAAAPDSPAHPSRPLALSMACRAWMSAPHGSAPSDRWQGHGSALHRMAQHGMGWHGVGWHGIEWNSMECAHDRPHAVRRRRQSPARALCTKVAPTRPHLRLPGPCGCVGWYLTVAISARAS